MKVPNRLTPSMPVTQACLGNLRRPQSRPQDPLRRAVGPLDPPSVPCTSSSALWLVPPETWRATERFRPCGTQEPSALPCKPPPANPARLQPAHPSRHAHSLSSPALVRCPPLAFELIPKTVVRLSAGTSGHSGTETRDHTWRPSLPKTQPRVSRIPTPTLGTKLSRAALQSAGASGCPGFPQPGLHAQSPAEPRRPDPPAPALRPSRARLGAA